MNYFIYLYIYFFGYFKGKYSFVFRYFGTVRSCWSSFFSFFFNYLGTNRIESLGNFANEISRLFNLILIRVKFFFFFFFFFKYLETDMYIYISSKYFTLIIFHIGTRLKYLKFRGLRARTEIWIIPFYILQFLCKYFRLNIRILLYKYLKKK